MSTKQLRKKRAPNSQKGAKVPQDVKQARKRAKKARVKQALSGKADFMFKGKGSSDSRVTQVNGNQLYMSGVSNAINIISQLSFDAMWGVGYSYINAAVQRGWLANAANSDYPYAAWQYMSGMWINMINGTVPQGTVLPKWMWAIGRAIAAKTVPKCLGEVYYKNEASAGSIPSTPTFNLGPVAYGYEGNLFVPALTETDLFPNATAPAAPTDQEAAFLSLCGFMKNPDRVETEMSDSSIKTIFDNDVSAFSTVIDVTGWGEGGNGGTGFLATLEVPVHTPMISTLMTQVANGVTGSPTRFANRATEFGGDELFAANCVSNLLPSVHWKTKKSPKFKFVDFMEFYDVMALWTSKVITQYFLDPANAVSSSFGVGEVTTTAVCPITLQEMGLLLRNEIMFAFGATQVGVQSILPVIPSNSSDNQFMPFLGGNTGSAVQSFGMKLPLPLVENLRSLIIHILQSRNPYDIEMLYPVIGKYFLDELVTTNYSFTSLDASGDPVQNQTFTTVPPVLRRRKVSASKTTASTEELWEKTTVETPIDFIDTSNGTSYVFINDPGRLKTLTALWNDWVSTFAPYSSQLGPFSADPGVNVLTSVNQTRYWTNTSTASLARNANSRDVRVEAKKGLSSTVYSSRECFAVSFREKPFQATGTITTNWILPITKLVVGTTGTNATTFVKCQAMNNEEFSVTTSSTSDSGMTLATIHDDFASSMVHAKGTKSTFDLALEDLSCKGEAGILSSLVAGFLGNTFGSTVGTLASTVASALPI